MERSDLTTYVCLFHNADRAEAVINALEGAGFNRSSVTSIWNQGDTRDTASLDDELTAIGVPGRDLAHLKDGVAKGGVVIRLEAPESRSDDIEKIFHRYSADKIDETELNLGGAVGAVAPVAAAAVVPPVTSTEPVVAAEGAVVPVVAEQLVVGKREVERGGVRVFRRVVEEPVSEQVSLHSEQVVINTRAVDRPVTEADRLAGEQVIELTETQEVPVVAKVARVVEEVHVGKVETERTETVRDTVRHTEVDVEPVNESATTTGTGRLDATERGISY